MVCKDKIFLSLLRTGSSNLCYCVSESIDFSATKRKKSVATLFQHPRGSKASFLSVFFLARAIFCFLASSIKRGDRRTTVTFVQFEQLKKDTTEKRRVMEAKLPAQQDIQHYRGQSPLMSKTRTLFRINFATLMELFVAIMQSSWNCSHPYPRKETHSAAPPFN